MPKPELSANGLMGVVEAMSQAAKRFQEFEDRYTSNQALFAEMQQRFQQMQDTAGQLQSLTEERLAAMNALNVELKVRHSQGEQTWSEVQALVEGIRIQQAQWAETLASGEAARQVEAERAEQMAQAVAALRSLGDQLHSRQSQLEQCLVAAQAQLARWEQNTTSNESQHHVDGEQVVQATQAVVGLQAASEQMQARQDQMEQSVATLQVLMEEQGQRYVDQEKVLSAVRNMVHQVADRGAQTEKDFSIMQATVEAEKGLLGHFERSLDAVRTMAAEMQKRQAAMEVALKNPRATSSGDVPAIGDKTLAALRAMVEEAQRAAAKSAEQVAGAEQKSAQALESAQLAQQAATEALQKASEAYPLVAPGVELTPEDQKKAAGDFQHFLARCHADHKAALEQHSRLQTQTRMAVEGLPARAESTLHKFLEQGRHHLEQTWTQWVQHRENRVQDMEGRYKDLVDRAAEAQRALEQAAAQQTDSAPNHPPAGMTEWIESLQATAAKQSSEMRFMKTLMLVSLVAVGIAYALVAYALILKS